MYRRFLTGLVAALVLTTSSLAQNKPLAGGDVTASMVERAKSEYESCLTKAYFVGARGIPDKEKIANNALTVCRKDRAVLTSSFAKQQAKVQAQAEEATQDTEKTLINELSRKYDEKANNYLTLLGYIRTAYINCPSADKDFGKGLYSFVIDELIYNFAFYENDAARQGAITRTLGAMAGDIAKSNAETWCKETQAKLRNDDMTKGFLFNQ